MPVELTLRVTGMTCAACVRRVEKAVSAVDGVTEAAVNLATNTARVALAPGAQPTAAIVGAIRDAGYGVETERIDAEVEGIFCASCVKRIEDSLLRAPGVIEANAGGGSPIASGPWRDCNVNELTDPDNRDPISGFPVYKALLCEVVKA